VDAATGKVFEARYDAQLMKSPATRILWRADIRTLPNGTVIGDDAAQFAWDFLMKLKMDGITRPCPALDAMNPADALKEKERWERRGMPPPPIAAQPAGSPARPASTAASRPPIEAPDRHGDETTLSSKKWIYAGYFNRLKRMVAQNWDPATVIRRIDPMGTTFGFKTRITEVRASLSRKGELAEIVVNSSSGVVEFDDEAVRAFRAAGPFPQPPPDLDEHVTFSFNFVFELGAPRITWRLPRAL
jgi:TonB family protein